MQTSPGNPSDPDELTGFESWLARSLYRFDCPIAHTLGEYVLDVLSPDQRTSVAGHVTECELCGDELSTLREFLAMPTTIPEPLMHRVRRILATPLAPSRDLAYGGMRGIADSTARIYQADGITITISPADEPGSLIGLIVVSTTPAPQLDGREVCLVPETGPRLAVQLDDLGNFEVQGLRPGEYALEIDLPDDLVVVESLRVD